MECEKVRDRFSSLLENELDPLEERTVREHLASCPDCQKDLEQFSKIMRWLHFVKDVEVPDGFLSEINKKMEEPKRKVPFLSLSLKLPAQALAMVAIVFLVLYITKIMPVERLFMKEAKHTKPFISEPLTEEKKVDQLLVKKEREKEGVAAQPSLKETEKSKIPPSETIPAPSEKKKIELALIAKEKVSPAAKPPQEMVLRTSDREKTLNQIQILLQQFEGKIITTEGNVFLASLPAAKFSEFEKELLELSSPGKADKRIQEKDIAESYGVSAGARRIGGEEKAKKPSNLVNEQESQLAIRILLLQE
jgi:hypothetical protein